MAEEIHGIVGSSGRAAEVDDGGLRVNPRTAFEQAVIDGRAFAWAGLTEDATAHDTLLALENNSPTDVLKIHKLIVTTDNTSQIQVFTASGVTPATTDGAAVVGVNLNRASGRSANATCYTDDTGNTEQGSSYPGKILTQVIIAATPTEILFDGAVALLEDHMVGVDLTTASTSNANATFIGWFEPIS